MFLSPVSTLPYCLELFCFNLAHFLQHFLQNLESISGKPNQTKQTLHCMQFSEYSFQTRTKVEKHHKVVEANLQMLVLLLSISMGNKPNLSSVEYLLGVNSTMII